MQSDFKNVTILILITLCLGIFLIATTAVIAKDGTIFIQYAKSISASPRQTMIQEYQHPGYPVLILAATKIVGLFYKGGQLFLFIYSAQAASLLFRILSIIVLYFIAKEIVGTKFAFWAMIILIILPKPAEYGSDVLSDWPHMFFLAAGMLALLYGAKFGKWWYFAIAGLAGGLGYLIRPEGAQVVIYGFWWLLLQLVWNKRIIKKSHAVLGLISMLIIFIITVSPYMKLKGAIFPKKGVGTFSSMGILPMYPLAGSSHYGSEDFQAGIVPSKVAGGVFKIFENTGDTLLWFFLLPYFIGIYLHFKKHKLLEPNQFFIVSLVIVNVPLMIWLYNSHGYMSDRHTFPLVVFTLFFIPTGIQAWSLWLNKRYSKGFEHTHRWFAILMTIGIAICIPRLFMSLHPDKLYYRAAARWLAQNTESSSILAVPDYRISFYAERFGIKMTDDNIPEAAQYLVKIAGKKEIEKGIILPHFDKVFSVEDNKGKKEILIFKRISE